MAGNGLRCTQSLLCRSASLRLRLLSQPPVLCSKLLHVSAARCIFRTAPFCCLQRAQLQNPNTLATVNASDNIHTGSKQFTTLACGGVVSKAPYTRINAQHFQSSSTLTRFVAASSAVAGLPIKASKSNTPLFRPVSRGLSTSNEKKKEDDTQEEKEFSRGNLKKLFNKYGRTAIATYAVLDLTTLSMCYIAISRGLDVHAIFDYLATWYPGEHPQWLQLEHASTAGTFIMAIALNKITMPLRIAGVVTVVPSLSRFLKAKFPTVF